MWAASVILTTLCAGVVSVAGARVQRRDGAPFVPDRVNIPLMYDSTGRYVISVQMGPSRLNLTMTTGSGMTYVAGNTCTQCASDSVNLYNRTQSTTAEQFSNVANTPFFNSTTSASIIKENCSLPAVNGSLWVYANQTVAVMNNVPSNFLNQASGANIASGVSGLVGLGTNRGLARSASNTTYSPNFGDSIMGQFLTLHPDAQNFSFGVAMEKPVVTPKANISPSPPPSGVPDSAGIVHWLQPDPESYDMNTLAWASVNNTQALQSSLATDPQDWVVTLDGWVFIDGANSITNRKQVVANVDPLYQGIYIPLDQASLIHAAIPGSIAQPQVSTLGSLAQTWQIPCDSTFTMGIIVSSQTFTLDSDSLIIPNGDGTCTSGLEAWTDSNVNQYLLGARFMSAVYLIFNVPRDGPSSIGFANRATQHSKSHTGAIVGGTVGGVIGVLILALLAWYYFFYRRRFLARRSHSPYLEEDKPSNSTDTNGDGNIVPYPVFAQHHHSPSSTGFSEAQTASEVPTSIPTSPSQIVFVNQHGQIQSPISPHSPTPLMSFAVAQSGGQEAEVGELIAPPAYEEREGSMRSGHTRNSRTRPREKGPRPSDSEPSGSSS